MAGRWKALFDQVVAILSICRCEDYHTSLPFCILVNFHFVKPIDAPAIHFTDLHLRIALPIQSGELTIFRLVPFRFFELENFGKRHPHRHGNPFCQLHVFDSSQIGISPPVHQMV